MIAILAAADLDDETRAAFIREECVSFSVDSAARERLVRAGATPTILGAVSDACYMAGDAVPAATQEHLTALMNESASGWNRGDLDGFLSTYKADGQTAFMGPQITYGLSNIKARYERSYFKDGKPKAQLSFGDLKFRKLGPAHILMTGRWYLQEPAGTKTEGYYTLVWENTDGGWKMIHDHSS